LQVLANANSPLLQNTLASEFDKLMTSPSFSTDVATRQRWLAVLARAELAELEQHYSAMGELPQAQAIRAAEVGMVMLRGRIAGTGDAFNLGEASVTRCALRLGAGPLGVGYTLGRNLRKAELVACFDALLQEPARQARVLRDVIDPLAQAQAQARDKLSRAVASSKVDFYTMVRGDA